MRINSLPGLRNTLAHVSGRHASVIVRLVVLICALAIPDPARGNIIQFVPGAALSDTLSDAKINWALGSMAGILPEATTVGFDTTTDLFTTFSVEWNTVTFDLLAGGVFQSVNMLPHGPAEFYNALFTGGTWEIQRDSQSLYYLVLRPSYGDHLDTGYTSAPFARPETTTVASGTFAVSPRSVPEPTVFALLVASLVGVALSPRRKNRVGCP